MFVDIRLRVRSRACLNLGLNLVQLGHDIRREAVVEILHGGAHVAFDDLGHVIIHALEARFLGALSSLLVKLVGQLNLVHGTFLYEYLAHRLGQWGRPVTRKLIFRKQER